MKHLVNKLNLCIVFAIIGIVLSGCEKMVQVPSPKNELINHEVYNDEKTATAAIIPAYTQLNNFLNYVNMLGDWTTDNGYYAPGGSFVAYYTNSLTVSDYYLRQTYWYPLYQCIYTSNSLIEGLRDNENISINSRNQLVGEAKFMRAVAYFYLINLFGDVPLITSTDISQSTHIARTNSDDIYNLIISDLVESSQLLTSNYITGEKVRANRWASKSLLARVFLYKENWERSEEVATEVISSGDYHLVSLNETFKKNSNEAIFQIWNQNGLAFFGQVAIPNPATGRPVIVISEDLYSAFTDNDLRKSNWINDTFYNEDVYHYPYKYKLRSTIAGSDGEYEMVIRLAELYLIRAEARVKQNDLSGGISDINKIKVRAGLSELSNSLTQADCFLEIENERRRELFYEASHRLMDLKRTGRIDAVLTQKKANWKPTAALYPIPQAEIDKNTKLLQNPGY